MLSFWYFTVCGIKQALNKCVLSELLIFIPYNKEAKKEKQSLTSINEYNEKYIIWGEALPNKNFRGEIQIVNELFKQEIIRHRYIIQHCSFYTFYMWNMQMS